MPKRKGGGRPTAQLKRVRGDGGATTAQLAPIEIEALLHPAESAPPDAPTMEMIPLVQGPPEPPARVARGSEPMRPRRTVERLAITDILPPRPKK